MSLITLDGRGLYQEAKKNQKSEIGTNYFKPDITNTWNTVAAYILEVMKTYNGVEIPNLGTFTFQAPKGTADKLKPCFKVSTFLTHMYQVSSSEVSSKDIRTFKINKISVADKMSKHYHVVSVCMKEALHALNRLLSQGKDVDFPFQGVCVLQFRKGSVKGIFEKDFLEKSTAMTAHSLKGDNTAPTKKEQDRPSTVTDKPVMGAIPQKNHICGQGSRHSLPGGKDKVNKENQTDTLQTVHKECQEINKVKIPVDNNEEKLIHLSKELPLGARPSIMNLTFYDTNHPPVVTAPKHETFFHKIPITQLDTQDQVEIAIGECRENTGSVVCNKCANFLEKSYICDFARRKYKKVPEENIGQSFIPNRDNTEHIRRNKETAEYNRQASLQKMNFQCDEDPELSNDLFANRPKTADNAQREIDYRNELKETFYQREEQLALEHLKEKMNERREIERSKKMIEHQEKVERNYEIQRRKAVADENKKIIQAKQREHERQANLEDSDTPHIQYHYNNEKQQSKLNELNTAMCNLQLQAEKYQQNTADKAQQLIDYNNSVKRIQESLNVENAICGMRKNYLKESMNDWQRQIEENQIKKAQEIEREKEPQLALLDQLIHIKRCTICKKDLTGSSNKAK